MTVQFQNKQLFSDDIANVKTIEFIPISSALKTKWILILSIVFIAIAAVISIVDILISFVPWVVWIAYTILAIAIIQWPRKAVKYMSYAIRENDILYFLSRGPCLISKC